LLQVQGRRARHVGGVAMEVPLMVLVAVLEVYQAEVMDWPGAKRSRHFP